jgi:hypothetical protein
MGEGTRGLGRCSGTREVKGQGWLGTFREEGSASFLTLRHEHGMVGSCPPAMDEPQRQAWLLTLPEGRPRRTTRHPCNVLALQTDCATLPASFILHDRTSR